MLRNEKVKQWAEGILPILTVHLKKVERVAEALDSAKPSSNCAYCRGDEVYRKRSATWGYWVMCKSCNDVSRRQA